MRLGRWVGWAWCLLAPALAGAQDLSCDQPGAVEVRAMRFEGNRAFAGATLADGVITTPSSLLRRSSRLFGTRRCLDRTEFANDVVRLQIFYRNHGYASVRVDTTVTPVGSQAVAVRFRIAEGPLTRVDTLRVDGLDAVPERARLVAGLPLVAGGPFDKYALQRSVDTLTRRLRNGGYPTAEVFFAFSSDTAARRASVTLEAVPGTRAVVGDLRFVVTPPPGRTQPSVDEGTLRALLGVRPGDLYRESSLERAKRSLYQTDIWRLVSVDVDSADVEAPGAPAIDVQVTLTEALTRSTRLSGGYGTLDCFRADGEYTDLNAFGAARRLEVRGRVSKLGIGDPVGGAPELCPTLRDDPYSADLNYYAGVSLVEATDRLFSWRPSATLYSERRSEFRAFLRETPVGAILTNTRTGTRRRTFVTSYQLEYGRTQAQPALFCALQSVCTAEDREPLLDLRRLAVAGLAASQDWSDQPANPTRGGVARVELRSATTGLGTSAGLEFTRGTADLALYRTLRRGIVLALRARAGFVTGPDLTGNSAFIPAQERLFAGGPTSVRGFEQSDLGPKVYIARGFDTLRVTPRAGPIGPDDTVFFRARNATVAERSVPTGGTSLLVGNVELRLPSPLLSERLQWTVFADAGELWIPGASQRQDRFNGLKVTPGIGLRVLTPFGVLRLDAAYNRYAPRTGAAYFDAPVLAGGQLYCVSPGNLLPVTGVGVPGAVPVQASGPCPTDFTPRLTRQRLRFAFAIGQAF
jgi:outer membrane protein assembly factor BamA